MSASLSQQQADHGNLKVVEDALDGTGAVHVIVDSGGGGGGDATAANQATQITAEQAIQATAGATTGAAVITDANGTIQQYLRGLIKLAITAGSFLVTATLAAGSAIIGKVGIDQTTPGTTNAVAPISGQAGVAGGAGAVAATVQRVTLASDDPAVAALQILDNAIAGSEMQVDVVAALPAGSNAIGKLAANSGVDIGDVDVLTIGGQAPTYGAGAVAAGTPRVTHASDDPVTAALQIIDNFISGSRGLVTEDNSAAIKTAVEVIDNAIAGSEMQVDVVAALPTGSNVIGAVTNVPLTNIGAGEYETVAASQTAQVLGATGAIGDYISGLLVIPATTSPGQVLLLDNATSITVFVGGASSVSNLVPFFIPLGMISVSGAWKITTGASVSVIGIGNFA